MEKDQLKELFNETFKHFEQEVRPDLWNSIASQINMPTAVSAGTVKGISLISKIVLSTAVTASLVVVGIIVSNQSKTTKEQQVEKTKEQTTQDSIQDTLITTQHIRHTKTKQVDFCLSPKKQEKLLSSTIFSIDEATSLDITPETLLTFVKSSNVKTEQNAGIQVNEEKKETRQTTEALQPAQDQQQNTVNPVENMDYFLGELPNVFTPNKDGINDVFLIDSKGLTDFSIVILDKNNRIVFQSNSPDFTWDGVAMDGQECEMNQYIYFITAKSSSGKMITQHHLLTLQR